MFCSLDPDRPADKRIPSYGGPLSRPYAIQSSFPDFCFSGLFTRTDLCSYHLSRDDKASQPASQSSPTSSSRPPPRPCPDSLLPTVYFYFHIQSIAMLLTHRATFPGLFCPIKFSSSDRQTDRHPSLLIHPTPRHRQTGRREVIS